MDGLPDNAREYRGVYKLETAAGAALHPRFRSSHTGALGKPYYLFRSARTGRWLLSWRIGQGGDPAEEERNAGFRSASTAPVWPHELGGGSGGESSDAAVVGEARAELAGGDRGGQRRRTSGRTRPGGSHRRGRTIAENPPGPWARRAATATRCSTEVVVEIVVETAVVEAVALVDRRQ